MSRKIRTGEKGFSFIAVIMVVAIVGACLTITLTQMGRSIGNGNQVYRQQSAQRAFDASLAHLLGIMNSGGKIPAELSGTFDSWHYTVKIDKFSARQYAANVSISEKDGRKYPAALQAVIKQKAQRWYVAGYEVRQD